MEPSTSRLVAALKEQQDPKLRKIIEKAENNIYNDFKSPLTAPIATLVNDLTDVGHNELAQRAINGDFDATPEESEAWFNSSEGQEIFSELFTKN